MKRSITLGLVVVLGLAVTAWAASDKASNPVAQILALLTDSTFGLEEIKNEVRTIEETINPESVTLSSGLFGLPADAASVDWMVVNNSSSTQTFKVTVYKVGVGAKTVVPPGTLSVTVAAGAATHNANSVGNSEPFVPGFYYEVVVEGAHPNLLPSVHVWEDYGNTVIPGTLIPPGSWVRLD